ncbi:arsenate reductase ArsC [Agaribacter flavus]|uniref:Arsenate reductase ArsC n=1 Tax=Agaribacter flavus TaxID=1902781 RepID=A0ABV7FLJ8_9ALTE
MRILYICTHNRCRSILSEAITNQLGAKQNIIAKSAGSQPVGEVHPLSLKHLSLHGIETKGLESQSWHEFDTFQPDLVITVCDSAAQESCPVYFTKTNQLHWGLRDPSKMIGTEAEVSAAFEQCIDTIKQRVNKIIALKMSGLSASAIKAEIQGMTCDD